MPELLVQLLSARQVNELVVPRTEPDEGEMLVEPVSQLSLVHARRPS